MNQSCIRTGTSLLLSIALSLPPLQAARAESAEQKRDKAVPEIPHCAKKIGSASIVEPENKWWREFSDIGSPEALIRLYVRQSGCFTLVNRGRGFEAALQERDLASAGELRRGSNVGKGQIKTADYIIVPDLVTQNRNKGGTNVGGIIGGLLGGPVGGLIGGAISLKKKSANVILYVTDTRSSEEVAASEGRAEKRDLGWAGGGGLFAGGGFGAAGASGYSDTEIGQVIALAYLDAYSKMVAELGGLPGNASAANQQQAVSLKRPGKLYADASLKAKVVTTLDAGQLLYPTGVKKDPFWEVEDELGNKGWVSMTLLELAK